MSVSFLIFLVVVLVVVVLVLLEFLLSLLHQVFFVLLVLHFLLFEILNIQNLTVVESQLSNAKTVVNLFLFFTSILRLNGDHWVFSGPLLFGHVFEVIEGFIVVFDTAHHWRLDKVVVGLVGVFSEEGTGRRVELEVEIVSLLVDHSGDVA